MTDEILTMSADEAFGVVPNNILWLNILFAILVILLIIGLIVHLLK